MILFTVFPDQNNKRIVLALQSGLKSELTWALNTLTLLSFKEKDEVRRDATPLAKIPGLLDALLQVVCLTFCFLFLFFSNTHLKFSNIVTSDFCFLFWFLWIIVLQVIIRLLTIGTDRWLAWYSPTKGTGQESESEIVGCKLCCYWIWQWIQGIKLERCCSPT